MCVCVCVFSVFGMRCVCVFVCCGTLKNGENYFLLHLLQRYVYIFYFVTDTTTFGMDLCGCKQATAQANVQSRCM